MPSAVILMNSEIGKESEILDVISRYDEVDRAYLLYGVYDILAEITTGSMDDLEEIITRKIRMIPGVRSTLTLIVSKRSK
ncbi:MAG: Lrp/AsnC family transcriptional regulator [Methanomassiliicoccales archaeon]|nr:Lrp/AsnC family transcriptional regulator [Methanomassiliicoccales archaeon]